MFLQGTVSVYSKKVEFLWQTVLKMLDTLPSKRAIEEAEGTKMWTPWQAKEPLRRQKCPGRVSQQFQLQSKLPP